MSTKFLTMIGTVALVAACATKTELQADNSLAPAARGELKTRIEGDQNMRVELSVKHLAPPQNLASGASSYVIWVDPEGEGGPMNIGSLNVNDDLEGRYETRIPYHNFRLFVTPESSRVARSPSGPVVFEQSVTE